MLKYQRCVSEEDIIWKPEIIGGNNGLILC